MNRLTIAFVFALLALCSGVSSVSANPVSAPRSYQAPKIEIGDAGGTWTYYQLPSSESPGGITLGPDGNLWFTSCNPGIDRITPTGVDTSFSAQYCPVKIISGPDGNLWFLNGANQVGKVTPQGQVTEFATQAGYWGGLASGPGQVVWFSIDDSPFTTFTATITEGGNVTNIGPYIGCWDVTGADGDVWATCFDDTINTLSPSGQETQYQVTTLYDASVWGLTEGLDGAIWFYVQPNFNEPGAFLGRLDVHGNETQFSGVGRLPTSENYGIPMVYTPNGVVYLAVGQHFVRFKVNQHTFLASLWLPKAPSGNRPILTDVTVGPNGTLWFTACNHCGRTGNISYVGEYVPKT